MASSMAELITLLIEKEKAMEELALALTAELNCIVALDLAALAENGRSKAEVTARLTDLQKKCGALLCRTGDELGLAGNRVLSPLVDAAPPVERAELRPLQQRLIRLARRVERQLAVNRGLLENSLAMIKSSMALFGRLLGGCDTYGAHGAISSGSAGGNILRREI